MMRNGKAKQSKISGILAVQPTSDAFERLKHAGIECGVDPRAMEQLVVRLQGRPPSADGRLKLDDTELLALIDDGIARAFQNLDDFSLGQSSARDLSVTIGVLTDKRKALQPEDGGPVQNYQDIKKMDEMALMLHAECVRRGLLEDATPEQAKDQPDSIAGPAPV